MLIATLSYSKFESIQLQREESAAKSVESRKCFLLCKRWGLWHCHLLTDIMQSVFLIKRMWPTWS